MASLQYFTVLSVLIVIAYGCQPPDCKNVDCGTCGMQANFIQDLILFILLLALVAY